MIFNVLYIISYSYTKGEFKWKVMMTGIISLLFLNWFSKPLNLLPGSSESYLFLLLPFRVLNQSIIRPFYISVMGYWIGNTLYIRREIFPRGDWILLVNLHVVLISLSVLHYSWDWLVYCVNISIDTQGINSCGALLWCCIAMVF